MSTILILTRKHKYWISTTRQFCSPQTSKSLWINNFLIASPTTSPRSLPNPTLKKEISSTSVRLSLISQSPKRRLIFRKGIMERRVGLLLLVLLGASWFCDARQLGEPELSVMQVRKQEQEKESQALGEAARNEDLCTLCEDFATKAVDYFAENKTQTEILDILHKSCSHLPSFEQQCTTLVNYYAPLFFLEISTVQPPDFCRKVNLCQQVAIFSSQLREDSCELCHRAVSEVLIKLKDPDTQLEILELLLKGCNSMENYAKKCKKMVFEYGPLILANAEQFLETNDVCTLLHACKSSTVGSNEEAAEVVNVLADS